MAEPVTFALIEMIVGLMTLLGRQSNDGTDCPCEQQRRPHRDRGISKECEVRSSWFRTQATVFILLAVALAISSRPMEPTSSWQKEATSDESSSSAAERY